MHCDWFGTLSTYIYHKFINKYAEIRQSFNRLLKKNILWEWNSNSQNSFQNLKAILIAKPILKIYYLKLALHMFVDTSKVAVGSM